MVATRFERDDGVTSILIDLPEADACSSVLPIAYNKAGSVLLDGIIKSICKVNNRSYVNIESELFNRGELVHLYQNAIRDSFYESGMVYGVYRTFLNVFNNSCFLKPRIIVLVRDPRDVVVSYYYSVKNSHFIPKEGDVKDGLMKQRSKYEELSLNEAILKGEFDFMFSNIVKVANFVAKRRSEIELFLYEDVIFKKYNFIKAVAAILSSDLTEKFISELLTVYDIVPTSEDPRRHIRTVTPGDHLRKLSPEVIGFLNNRYKSTFQTLGYI